MSEKEKESKPEIASATEAEATRVNSRASNRPAEEDLSNKIPIREIIQVTSTMLASYQLCNTHETLSIALKYLSTAKTVYFDCGILSILSLRCVTSTSEVKNSATLSIFLIDVPAFQTYTHQANTSPLVPVFAILTSKEVLKVGFDLSMDESELRHGHDVVITHVLDLQIVDLMCRDKSEEAVLQRLAGYLAPREVFRNREIYKHVLRLSGLDKALIDQGQSVPRKPKFDHSKWMDRPIDEDSVVYAAEDVSKTQVLYKLLVRNPLVNQSVLGMQEVFAEIMLSDE
ncbi:SubName: Full=Uncharacterized protein {ECO:0000313/EMBL:CCA74328.1} [Serendipita indica DSM 11827]|nr:SubName: Full=Uncharacterized protein {ECO:0000313/EMBL:CCA74328.1} [Serendipita indica DSM 11827]